MYDTSSASARSIAFLSFTSKFSCYPSLPCTQMRTLSHSQLCLQHLVPCRRSLDACFQNERVKGLDGWMDGSRKPFPPLSRRIPLALGPRGLLVSLGFAVCRRAPEYFRHTWKRTGQFALLSGPCNLVACWPCILCVCVCVCVDQSCPTLCNPIDGSPSGLTVHGILQARTQEWVAVSFSKSNYRKKESEVSQSCPILCDPMDCSPPGSSIHGIFQARVLERVAVSFPACRCS